MRPARTKLAQLATTILFVANVAVPRASFYAHTHKGGEHEHVHVADDAGPSADADIDRALAEALGSSYLHPHHHHLHHHAGDLPTLEAPDDVVGTAHWHTQSPFQLAVAAEAPSLSALIFVAPAEGDEPLLPESAVPAPSRARAPPTL